MKKSVSILTYSHDGFGLGHLRRNSLIAHRLVKDYPHYKALMLVSHPWVPFVQLPYGIDFIKLPSIVKISTGQWAPRTLPMEQGSFRALRRSLIQKTVRLFKPDIFLADYTPTGVWRELVPILQELKKQKSPPVAVLGLRDILDAPEVTRKLWKDEEFYETIRRYYDKVLIYGSPSIFNTVDQYGLDGKLSEKVTYCGYLASDKISKSKELAREELGLRRERLIVVSGGGGYDAFPMMRTFLKAFREIADGLSVEALLITGPLMNNEHRETLEEQARNLPVRFVKWDEGTLNYLAAADLIVTMAGYNSLMDALCFKAPVIVIPRNGPSAEQRMRADLFSSLGLTCALEPAEFLRASTLAEVMHKKILEPGVHSASLPMNGLDNAIHEIGSSIEHEAIFSHA